jgi:hypothetical protein
MSLTIPLMPGAALLAVSMVGFALGGGLRSRESLVGLAVAVAVVVAGVASGGSSTVPAGWPVLTLQLVTVSLLGVAARLCWDSCTHDVRVRASRLAFGVVGVAALAGSALTVSVPLGVGGEAARVVGVVGSDGISRIAAVTVTEPVPAWLLAVVGALCLTGAVPGAIGGVARWVVVGASAAAGAVIAQTSVTIDADTAADVLRTVLRPGERVLDVLTMPSASLTVAGEGVAALVAAVVSVVLAATAATGGAKQPEPWRLQRAALVLLVACVGFGMVRALLGLGAVRLGDAEAWTLVAAGWCAASAAFSGRLGSAALVVVVGASVAAPALWALSSGVP